MKSRTKLEVKFRTPGGVVTSAKGREGQTLLALVHAGSKGITSLETFKAGWAVRLSAYVLDLKKMGVPIVMTREAHDGGRHGRYSLVGAVEILHVVGDSREIATG